MSQAILLTIYHQTTTCLRTLARDEKGQDILEYALIGAFVATCAVALFPAIAMTSVHFGQVISVIDVALSMTASQ
jgi:Flp pilus assembly pilin Flp